MSESLTISFNPQLAAGTMFSIPLTGSNSSVGTIKDNNDVTVGTLNQNNPTFTTTAATSSITLQVTSGYYTDFGRLGTALSGIVGFQPSNDAANTTWGLGSNGANAGLTNITDMFREINTDLLTGTGNYVYFPNYCPNTITNMTRTFHNNNNVDIAVAGLSTWQTGNVTDFFHTFRLCRKITVSLGSWDVTSATTFQGMFLSMSQTDALDATQINNWTLPSSSFTMKECFKEMDMNLDISTNGTKWVMTNCTDTTSMFHENETFNQNIGNWDTSNITDMNGMFRYALAFNQDIGSWDTSSVTDMSTMFRDASAFNQEIRTWDVSNVTSFNNMFSGASLMFYNFSAPTTPTASFFTIESLTISFNPQLAAGTYTLPLTGSNSSVGTVTDNTNGGTVGTLNQDSPTFTTTGATSSITLRVTSGYYTTFDQLSTAMSDIVGFQPSNDATSTTWGLGSNGSNAGLTNIENLFFQMNTDLLTGTGNYVYFPNYCPNTITNMTKTFAACNVDIAVSGLSTWQTGNVTDFSIMFLQSRKIAVSLGNWDVTSSTNFEGMFRSMTQADAIDATQINNWTLPSSGFSMERMFQSITMNLDISTNGTKWVMTNCTDFKFMFSGNTTFNQNIGNWNTSNVTTFQQMFDGATAFNQDISSWNTSSVTNLEEMFKNATAFNQDIRSWDVSSVSTFNNMFSGATLMINNFSAPNTPTAAFFDSTAPTAAITYDSVGPYKNGDTVVITATFNEVMLDSPVPQITITGSGIATVNATNMIKDSTTIYTFSYSVPTGDGTGTITLSAGTDQAGILITATPTSGNTFTVDNTAPVISQVTAIPSHTNDTTPNYVFTSGEAGTITSNLAFSSSSVANSGENTVTFSTLADGTYTGKTITVTDAAGNASNTLTIPDFTIDTAAPTAAITYDSVGPYKNGETVVITATFNEAMLDSPVPQIAIAGSGIATVNATNMTKDSSTVYTFSYSVPTGDGTGTITLTVGTDLAGNTITVNPTSGNTFTVDNTAPTISQVTAITTPGNDTTPSYVFSSNQAGTITSNLAFTSTTTASSGENTVTFNTLAQGTYTGKTITVTDAAGNVSNTLTIPNFVIDTTAPVVSPVTAITTPGNDTTPSYVFSTDKAGTITSSLAFTSTTAATVGNNTVTFNTLAEGTYTGKNIIVTDAAGNVSNHLIIADFVIDTTVPVLTLTGANPLPAELGTAFTDPGATSNGGETVSVSGTVNKDVIGDYTLTYSATDTAGNTGTITRNVQVRDNTAPVITLTGANPLTIQQHGTYTEPGATADGGETVSITGSVNVDVLGNYTITYSAADNVGNSSVISRTVRVIDDVASTITLIGPNPLILNLGATFIDPGATSSSGETVHMTTSLNTLVAGDYNVTYNSTDKNSNVGTAVRVVRVVNNEAYVGPKLKTLHNGITTAQNGMPLKDSTSDGGSSFSMGRMFFSRTYEAKPATEAAVLQVNKNKWIGSNRDASSVARNRRNQAIGSNELNTSGSSMAFTNTNEENNIRNAIHRTRSGGSRVPAKVFNKNSGGSFYS